MFDRNNSPMQAPFGVTPFNPMAGAGRWAQPDNYSLLLQMLAQQGGMGGPMMGGMIPGMPQMGGQAGAGQNIPGFNPMMLAGLLGGK